MDSITARDGSIKARMNINAARSDDIKARMTCIGQRSPAVLPRYVHKSVRTSQHTRTSQSAPSHTAQFIADLTGCCSS